MARVRFLLRTRNDYLPTLRCSSPATRPGLEPEQRVYRTVEGKKVTVVEPDRYDLNPKAPASSVRAMDDARLDRELEILAVQLGQSDDTEKPYSWESARQRRDSQGSYRELERALATLPYRARHCLMLIYDSGLLELDEHQFDPPEGVPLGGVESLSVALLATRMGQTLTRIKIPSWGLTAYWDWCAPRVRELSEAGKSDREIGKAFGLSKRKVRETLDRKGV